MCGLHMSSSLTLHFLRAATLGQAVALLRSPACGHHRPQDRKEQTRVPAQGACLTLILVGLPYCSRLALAPTAHTPRLLGPASWRPGTKEVGMGQRCGDTGRQSSQGLLEFLQTSLGHSENQAGSGRQWPHPTHSLLHRLAHLSLASLSSPFTAVLPQDECPDSKKHSLGANVLC